MVYTYHPNPTAPCTHHVVCDEDKYSGNSNKLYKVKLTVLTTRCEVRMYFRCDNDIIVTVSLHHIMQHLQADSL